MQTGKLGSFYEILGAQLLSNLRAGVKNLAQGWARAARGAKMNAAMYMSNEYRYLKSILFNYYAGHGTGVHFVDMQPC